MIVLKKRNLAILLIIALCSGIVVMGVYSQVYGIVVDEISITAEEYDYFNKLKGDYAQLDELKEVIEERYYVSVDRDKLYEGIYKGLFYGIGDPYSAYLTKKEYEDLMIATSGEYEGIGVTIAPDKDGYINVVAPIDDTPAFKAGIKPEDKIIEVDGIEYNGDSIDAAAAAMRGEGGTKVDIKILRGEDVKDISILRAKITMNTVKSEVIDGDIGYIRISSFEKNTGEDFEQAVKDIEKAGGKSLILDLRDNPGGLVDVSVNVADSLLSEGIITYTEDRNGKKRYYKSDEDKISLPIAVLINGGSASASEIVAGAVKGNDGGKIIGTTSYGKGIIQEIVQLKNGDAIKLTIMQYFLPDGEEIHEKGIEPDYTVELQPEDFVNGVLDREKDRQLKKAIEVLRDGKSR